MRCAFIIFIALAALALTPAAADAAVVLNEVMPNPYDGCNDCTEWIELHSTGNQSLDGWKLNTGDDKNVSFNATIEDYLIITRNKEAFLSFWNISCDKVLELTISLTNGGDAIEIYDGQNNSVDSFDWSKDIGNKSWSRLDNGTFIECIPTPGAANNCTQQEQEENNESGDEEEQQEEDSEIRITDAPDEARFGESIDVEIEVYKGDTAKYAVYVYIEDDEGNKVSDKVSEHFREKYSEDTVEVELALKCLEESGRYYIVAEGLGEGDRKGIWISLCVGDEIMEEEGGAQDVSGQEPEDEVQEYVPMTSNAVSETPSFSLKSAMPYFLATLCSLTLIYVLLKKI